MIRCDQRGLASLVDSLLFLLVISALTASLIQMIPNDAQDGQEMAFICSVHSSLLRTSVFPTVEVSGLGSNETAVPVPVISAVISLLASFDRTDNALSSGSLESQIKSILEGFLASRYGYIWLAERGESCFSVRNGSYDAEQAHFVSVVSSRLPCGTEIDFSLIAWFSS